MEKKAFVRKHFFIDRRLQGRYMLTFFIPMLVMLVFLVFTIYLAVQNVVSASTRMVRIDVENLAASQFQDAARPEPVRKFEAALKEYLRGFTAGRDYRNTVVQSLLWVFGIGIFVVIVQVALLTVFFSHKVAGPIYRLEKVCHGIIEGDYTQTISLRKGDEMQNLAGLFNEVIRRTRSRLRMLQNNEEAAPDDTDVASLRL